VGHVAHARAGVNCVKCHQGMTDPEVAAPHLPDNAACEGCHTDDHKHPGQDCLSCHMEPDSPAALRQIHESLRFDHASHREAAKGQCMPCHRGAIENTGGTLPGHDVCGECHQGWIEEKACAGCHTSLARFPLAPLVADAHDGDFMRRHGNEARLSAEQCATCHTQSFCADCHDQRSPFPVSVTLADRPDRSFIHPLGYAEARHSWDARQQPQLCLTCHTESTCLGCHTAAGRGAGGVSPHGPGWASLGEGPDRHAKEARRDLLGCASCHSGPGAQTCVTCHAPGRPGGSPHRGRTIRGDAQRDTPCTACHGGGR
jgi:hypothetical protein